MIIVITSLTKRINLNVNILFVLFHLDMTWAQNSLGGLKESSKDLHHADIAGSMLTRNAFCKRCSTLYAKICKFLYSFVRLCELLDFTDSFFPIIGVIPFGFLPYLSYVSFCHYHETVCFFTIQYYALYLTVSVAYAFLFYEFLHYPSTIVDFSSFVGQRVY